MVVNVGMIAGARSIIRPGGDPRLGVVIALIFLNLAPVGLVILLAKWHGTTTASDFGLRRPPLALATGLVVAVGAVVLALTALSVAAFGVGDRASITDRLAADRGTLNALLVIVLVAVAAPLGEEFLFRGYLFRALANWRGVWPAAVTTSVVFSAAHVGWVPIGALIPITVFGLGACLLYQWTGSLFSALVLHALLNSGQRRDDTDLALAPPDDDGDLGWRDPQRGRPDSQPARPP
ncbi:MAG: CPBP family intramembrane metalloprotease [Actinomycetota bacterium]|nr:CPBP family intramembrane metalloprotease [Acidimicrobiia bacterium]MDQ3292899.1 CPBP family intramembrane metalloprotease [Actinomycetota bacterium]